MGEDTSYDSLFCMSGGGSNSGKGSSGRVTKPRAEVKLNRHKRRTASRSSVLFGEEMERDMAKNTPPPFTIAGVSRELLRESPHKADSIPSFHISSPLSQRVMPKVRDSSDFPGQPRTPSKSQLVIREITPSERNFMTPPVSGSRAVNKQLPPSFTTPLGTPTFKFVKNDNHERPVTPESVKLQSMDSISLFPSLSQLGQPSFSSLTVGATNSSTSNSPVCQGNFSMAYTSNAKTPVIHPFWSPSPKKVWSYLITGGVSDFLHSAIANVEDLVELQKNGSVYFSSGAIPFTSSHGFNRARVEFCQRWNRFSWKVELSQKDVESTLSAILMLPHNNPVEEIELAEGMTVDLGPVYQELPTTKIYLKWRIVEP